MSDFKQELLDKYNLTIEEYETFLEDCRNKVKKITDLDWSEIAEKHNVSFNSDTIRKGMQPPLVGGSFIMDYYDWKSSQKKDENNDDYNYLTQLRLEKQEIIKEKYKLFDERNDLKRQLRQQSRFETTIKMLEYELKTIADKRYIEKPTQIVKSQSGKDMIVMLSDLHIGAEYYHFTSCYNSDIAAKRLQQYLNKILEIKEVHHVEKCYVVLLGDLISGNIHRTISITNKENVINQVKLASELISDFVYELSCEFSEVIVHTVSGNHSRLDKKDDALNCERLDSLISWFIGKFLQNKPNIIVNTDENNLDDTLFSIDIRDNIYIGVHGDYDSLNTKFGIENLTNYLGYTPYAILCGHKHYPLLDFQVKPAVVQCGCLGGSGDDFTVQKRLKGQPSQTVLIVDKEGIQSYHPIFFE